MCGARLGRAARLRSSKDFVRVKDQGRRVATSHFVLLIASRDGSGTPDPGPRLGLTVSRRVGNAVQRNRTKRLIREWFRGERCSLPAGSDVVVIARTGAAGLTRADVDAELRGAVASR